MQLQALRKQCFSTAAVSLDGGGEVEKRCLLRHALNNGQQHLHYLHVCTGWYIRAM